mgnify:CR=1 FL=1
MPLQISRNESAPARWQNNIATNWYKLENPFDRRYVPCLRTNFSNSIRGISLRI